MPGRVILSHGLKPTVINIIFLPDTRAYALLYKNMCEILKILQ
jgi:hypothetical protein